MALPQTEYPQVVKSNALVEASYRLDLYEQRLLLSCISQVNSKEPLTDQVMYSVYAKDIAQESGVPVNSAYRHLANAARRLKRREVWLSEKPNGGGRHDDVVQAEWVQTVRYMKREGRIDLRFNHDILPYLSEIKKVFTKYAYSDIATMTSAYGIRLYEMLVQWEEKGFREISIDWLRERLELQNRYPAYKDFRKRVIEPAIEQINERSPLSVKWEARKTGRSVSHIFLAFERTPPARVHKALPRPSKANGQGGSGNGAGGSTGAWSAMYGIPRPVIEARANPGESYDDCALRILDERRNNGV